MRIDLYKLLQLYKPFSWRLVFAGVVFATVLWLIVEGIFRVFGIS